MAFFQLLPTIRCYLYVLSFTTGFGVLESYSGPPPPHTTFHSLASDLFVIASRGSRHFPNRTLERSDGLHIHTVESAVFSLILVTIFVLSLHSFSSRILVVNPPLLKKKSELRTWLFDVIDSYVRRYTPSASTYIDLIHLPARAILHRRITYLVSPAA